MKIFIGILCLFAVSSKCNGSVGSVYRISGTGSVYEGGSISWTCYGSGCSLGECSYKWTSSLIGSTVVDQHLRLSDIRQRGSHSIRCTVNSTDNHRISYRNKNLRVYYGPSSISITPNSPLTINEGTVYGSTYPRCQAHDCDGCKGRWILGGVQKASSYTLFSSSVTANRSHAGNYTCEVWNIYSINSKQSQSLEVIVNYPPDVMTSWNGLTNTISCEVIGVPANYNFRFWTHVIKGVTIRQIVGIKKGADTLLHFFDKPTYADSGDYICRVDNGLNSSDTGTLIVQQAIQSLLIYGKPEVVEFMDAYSVSKGDSVNISFEIYALIQGTPTLFKHHNNGTQRSIPTNEYTYNSVRRIHPVPFYEKKANVTTYRQTITILSVEEDYFGNFTVRFENPQGISEVNVTLIPKGVPDIPTNLSIMDATHNSVALVFTTGFANGPNQWVTIEYISVDTDSIWNNGVSMEVGVPSNATFLTTVRGLTTGTHYMFRAYANNSYYTSNYTEEYVNATTLPGETETDTSTSVGYIALTMGVLGGCGVILALTVLAVYLFKRTSKKQISGTGKLETRAEHTEGAYEDLRHSTLGIQCYAATTPHSEKQEENMNSQEDKSGNTFNEYEDVEPQAISKQPHLSNKDKRTSKKQISGTGKLETRAEHTEGAYEDMRHSTLGIQCYAATTPHSEKQEENMNSQEDKSGNTFNEYEDVEPQAISKQPHLSNKDKHDKKKMSTIPINWQRFRDYFTNKNRNEAERAVYEDLQCSSRDVNCYELTNMSQTSSPRDDDDPSIIAALEASLEIYTDDVVTSAP